MLSYEFRTITPVFGAGVKIGELDKTTPLRGTTVRGHLRFWWRATCGRQFESLQELRQAEDILWGSATVPGKVSVIVTVVKAVPVMAGNQEKFNDNYPPYALFPFQPTREQPNFPEVWKSLSFTLSINSPPEQHNEVKAAVWAWANFGGIGSRTRRGCGALFCADLAPKSPIAQDWISKQLTAFPIPEQTLTRPLLNAEPLLKRYSSASAYPVPLVAWEEAIRVLAEFRQLPPLARNGVLQKGAKPQFGRSHWPEADSLRAASGLGLPRHKTSKTLTSPITSPAFPRAELGLPYQVKFKDKREDNNGNKNDLDSVNDCMVYPTGSKRMASPVICRPLGLGPKGDQALPMILMLSSPGPAGIRIERKNRLVSFSVAPVIQSPILSTYAGSPMFGKSPGGSALEAFMNYARTRFK
jgi:CRISPR-associated protein Cmr1